MKYALLLLLICAVLVSSAGAVEKKARPLQKTISETILSAPISKWESLDFVRYLNANGKPVSYEWQRQSATRDRRIPGVYNEDVHCFFMAWAADHVDAVSNVTEVSESADKFHIVFEFGGYNGKTSKMTMDVKKTGDGAVVAFSGNGEIFEEFRDYMKKCKQRGIESGEMDPEMSKAWNVFKWTYRPILAD